MNKCFQRKVAMAMVLLTAALLVTACASTPEPTTVPAVVEPTQPATAAPAQPSPEATIAEPTQPPEPTATAAPPPTIKPDPATGQRLWIQKPCAGCHGLTAEGIIGPKLAGTSLSFKQVLLLVRSGKATMPPFSEADVSDQELQHMYAWLRSLTP